MRTLLTALLCCLASAVGAVPFGGVFLDTGLGARAAGMGGAVSATTDGPAAVLYNPAGLAARRARNLLASYQPLSLNRSRASLAGSINVRGPLAFGAAWLHAGVDGLRARNGSGEVIEGGIDDGEDAFLFGLGINATPQLQLGLTVKIIDQRIDAPQGSSTANGRAVDLGLRYRLGESTVIGVAARNLLDKLSWSVTRPSAQTSTSEEALMSALAAGVTHRWRGSIEAAADAELLDVGDSCQLRVHAGIEARVNDLLTLRTGVHRMGDADGFGLPAFGLTVRPMRLESVQLHYAWVADDLDAGGRALLTLSSRF